MNSLYRNILFYLLFLCIKLIPVVYGSNIIIDTSALLRLHPNDQGVNMAFMYGHIDAPTMDSTDNRLTNERYSTALAEAIATYQPGILRFPGGTVGNYYHYFRPGGYGSDTLDLLCKEQTLPNTYPTWYVNDRKYTKNFIEPYTELNDYLRNTGLAPATMYVVNLTGPIYKGALISLNDPIKTFFQNQLGPNYGFFEVPVSSLDTVALKTIAKYTYTIFNEPMLKQFMKTIVADNSTVQLAVQENMAAIRHLLENDIYIAGIELGNELLSEYLLFDDDFSSNTFTCEDLNTLPPDQIPAATRTVDLPAIEVVTGMIKIWLLAELIQDSIRTIIDPPFGFPFEFPYSFMQVIPPGEEIVRVMPYGALYRLTYLWNQFWAMHDRFDATILHTYMQGFMGCDSLHTHTVDFLSDAGRLYTRFYTGEFLDREMEEMHRYIGNKKVWITEWNMNQAQLLGATFTHSTFVSEYFMNMLKRKMAAPGKYEYLVYHNMNNGGTSKYALFTTQKQGVFDSSSVRKQMAYFPHHMLSELRKKGYQYSGLSLLHTVTNNTQNIEFQHAVFVHPEDNRLAIWYINYRSDSVYIDLGKDSINFSGNTSYFRASATQHTALRAASMLSSNDACPASHLYTDTSFLYGELPLSGNDSIAIPPLSIGVIEYELSVISNIKNYPQIHTMLIYPNPGSRQFLLTLPAEIKQKVAGWKVFNTNGQEMNADIKQTGDETIRLYMSQAGHYLIIALLSDGSTAIGEVIVQ
jgi:hypothetical protein